MDYAAARMTTVVHHRVTRWILTAAALALVGSCGAAKAPPAPSVAISAPAPTAPDAAAPAAADAPAPETGPDDGTAHDVAHPPQVATGGAGAVASAEAQATAVGLDVLKRGGNAVDAAVAVGFALGVTHPTAGNIGGGGFMVIHLPDGTDTTIDFREVAPGKASRDMYLDAAGQVTTASLVGPRAAGIPGDVAGFALAHKRFGKLPWRELVAPAVALARDGHELDSFHAEDLAWGVKSTTTYLAELEADPKQPKALVAAVKATRALWQHPDGTPYVAGERWKQPELATTLEAIAQRGAPAFYRGKFATRLAAQVKAMGGLWTVADLAGYRAIERAPLRFAHHGAQIVTMPPPSAGGITLRQVLAASDILGLAARPWDSVGRIHLYVEALRRVYADRNLLIADPAFVDVPVETLMNLDYLRQRMTGIDPAHATASTAVGAGVELVEKPETTHFSVVDASGMAVATTFTLNGGFGAKVQVPGTGITLNNEMDDFTAKVGAPNMFGLVQGPQNGIAPGKRMVSSMTPTIVLADGKVRLVCGSPGGPTISTTVAQIVLQVLDYGRTLEQAIAASRIHHQWLPDNIWYEEGLAPATLDALKALGHELKTRGTMGHANCIEIDPTTGERRAVADAARDGGRAAAY